jgi:hypothetical protein
MIRMMLRVSRKISCFWPYHSIDAEIVTVGWIRLGTRITNDSNVRTRAMEFLALMTPACPRCPASGAGETEYT